MINYIQNFDNLLMSSITTLYENLLNHIMLFITNFGSFYFVIALFICLLIITKNKKEIAYLVVGSTIALVINRIIKYSVQRPRPDGFKLAVESGYSFPSAHAMMSTFIYGFLIYLILKDNKKSKINYLYSCALCVIILLISFSRIYLGVHYFSDVFFGIIFGVICLATYIKLFYKKNLLDKVKAWKGTK